MPAPDHHTSSIARRDATGTPTPTARPARTRPARTPSPATENANTAAANAQAGTATPPAARSIPLDQLRLHEHAGLVPAIAPSELEALRADIDRRGIQEPLHITTEGAVLDGRARLQAAIDLGHTTVPARIFQPPDELEHMLLAALRRRDLSQSQKAALTLVLHDHQQLRAEGRQRSQQNLRQNTSPDVAALPHRGRTRDLLADKAGCSPRTLGEVAFVKDHDAHLFQQVQTGKVGAEHAARKIRRAIRDRQLPEPPPMPDGPFDLAYADPPWELGNPDGPYAPENYYPTLTTPEIIARQPPFAESAVLFLWSVTSQRHQADQVITAWGFQLKSEIIWDKQSPGLGNWVRNQHETLLIARKGNYPCPEPEDRPSSVICAPRGRHSEKPQVFYQVIERMYPTASKLELYARRARPGWAAWGNQLNHDAPNDYGAKP